MVLPESFVKNTVISSLNGLDSMSKKNSFEHTYQGYFCLFYSTSLYVYLYVTVLISDYQNFVISFETRRCETSRFFFSR